MTPLDPKKRYSELRQLSYDLAGENLNQQLESGTFDTEFVTYSDIALNLTAIDEYALDAWEDQWHGHTDRHYDWDWKSEICAWHNTLSRFEVAVWVGGVLCGLAVGNLSKGKTRLSIHLLEGAPDPGHPLKKILRYCVMQSAEAYAVANECNQLIVLKPVEPAIPLYEEMGFESW